MTGNPLNVVTVHLGNRYPEAWTTRLANMVARHLQKKHRFIIYTETPIKERFQTIPSPNQTVEVRDLEAGMLQGYFGKLRLFDQDLTGTEPFLFLDNTLVIRSDLSKLVEIGNSNLQHLTGVRDWNYPILNSSVMWCKPNKDTQEIWESWISARYSDQTFPSDQNFIFRALKTEELGYWPEGVVCSYKNLRKLEKRDPKKAELLLKACTILKFHGHPKPSEVLQPWRYPIHTILKNPLTPRLWDYLEAEIKMHWH
jgi:hypothetical protein